MNYSNLISTKWLKDYAKWLPLVQWLGWVIIVTLLAKIVWLWVLYFAAPTEFKPLPINAKPAVSSSQGVDVSALLNRNLFGSIKETPKQVAVVQETVAPTRLNLKLRGIYATDSPQKANAIIEDNRGQQAVYFVDEKLNVSGRVFLKEVFFDRVILETNGVREQLSLEKEEGAFITVSSSDAVSRDDDAEARSSDDGATQVEDKRANTRLTSRLNQYREQLLEDPKSVADVITGQPHFVDGELKGFSIQPGKDKRLFQELGLRRDDVVTSINGVALTNMQDAMTLMNEAQSLQELTIEIQRGDEQLSLLLNLNNNVGRE